jgi:hypothetical protein
LVPPVIRNTKNNNTKRPDTCKDRVWPVEWGGQGDRGFLPEIAAEPRLIAWLRHPWLFFWRRHPVAFFPGGATPSATSPENWQLRRKKFPKLNVILIRMESDELVRGITIINSIVFT